VTQLLARALELVAPDSHRAGNLFSRYGEYLQAEMGDYEKAQHAFNQALAIAQREGDIGLEMRTLVNAARADTYQGRFQESIEKARRAIELSSLVNEPYAELEAHRTTARCLNAVADLGGARQHTEALLPLAERLQDRYWLISAYQLNSIQYSLVGEWQPAREFIARGLVVDPGDARLLARRVMLEYEVGDFSQGQLYLEQLLDSWSQTPPEPTSDYATPGLLIPLVVRITGVAERLEIAETIAQTIISSPTASFALDMFAKVGFAMLAVLRGDAAAAKEHYFALDSQRIPMLPGTTAVCLYRVLGLLAHTMGNLDQATGHFEDALAFCRMGNRPELAWTCCDYADTLLQREQSGDREKAMSLLEEALAISSELGMRPLMERVLSRRDILKA